jgi:hypothetical protein
MSPKFELGQVVTTPADLQALGVSGQDAAFFLENHARSDWGDVCHDDQRANDQALRDGGRLVSLYAGFTGSSKALDTVARLSRIYWRLERAERMCA